MWAPSQAAEDLLHGRYLILRRGKRTVGAVEVIPSKPQRSRISALGQARFAAEIVRLAISGR